MNYSTRTSDYAYKAVLRSALQASLQSLTEWDELASPLAAPYRVQRSSLHSRFPSEYRGYEFAAISQQGGHRSFFESNAPYKPHGKMRIYGSGQEINFGEPVPATPIEASPGRAFFDAINASITRSYSLLGLEDGWDDDNALKIEPSTWLRATKFLWNFFEWAMTHQVFISAPKIFPSVNGGIDLTWRRPTYRLLIHILPGADSQAEFTGKLPDGRLFEEEPLDTGDFDDNTHYTILEFLKNG